MQRDSAPDVVIVTGAAGGIGAAVARGVAESGRRVILADVAEPSAAVPPDCHWLPADVAHRADARRAVAAAAELGRLTGLVNVAGVRDYRPFLDIDEPLLAQHLQVNLVGPVWWMQEAARAMAVAGGGSIVNITSVMAHAAVAANGAYCSSKAGLLGLSRAAAVDLAPYGIRVNCVAPGPTDTPMLAAGAAVPARVLERIPLRRLAAPEEMVGAVLFLLSDESSFVTGTTIGVDGGYLAN